MLLTIGEPGDPEDDPTIAWPKDRKEMKAGTLTISSAMAQKGGGCERYLLRVFKRPRPARQP